MRQILISIHKYLGLFVGLLLAVIGLTGSMLVFDHAIDETLTPQIRPKESFQLTPRREPASLESVLANATLAVPGQPTPYRIDLARQSGSAHLVRFATVDGAPGPIEVSVAPASAEVLAVRTWGEYPMSWLYRLHYTLLAGDTGKYVVGTMGICLLFFCLSGLYLWWPRRNQWRRGLSITSTRGTFRFIFDLHKNGGFYFLIPLLLAAFTGIGLVFHEPVEHIVASALPLDERPSPHSTQLLDTPPIGVDQAVTQGLAAFPEASLKRVFLPQKPSDPFRLAIHLPGEPWSAYGASAVWVDQYSGRVLDSWKAPELASGSLFLTWLFPLHNGDALGLPGRWLVFVSGWVPALLFGTGLYMWWRKRSLPKARRHAAKKKDLSESLSNARQKPL